MSNTYCVVFLFLFGLTCCQFLTLWVRILFRRSVFHATLCDQVCQWLGFLWFPPQRKRTEILLKVVLNSITSFKKVLFRRLHIMINFDTSSSVFSHFWVRPEDDVYSMWPKVLPHVKKIPIWSTKTIFFQKIIVKSFLDRF